jgi:hypothetical protein
LPSPLGHALGGFAAGWLIAPRRPTPLVDDQRGWTPLLKRAARWRRAWLFAAVGLAADIDLLAGQHRFYTHSVGAVAAVFAVAWILTRGRANDRIRLPIAVAASYATHLVFDWLGVDSPAPRGILALWPLTDGHYVSNLDIFPVVSRKIWTLRAWKLNLVAALMETAILGPLAALCWRFRGRGGVG